MTSTDTLCKNLLHGKNLIVRKDYFFKDRGDVTRLRIHVHTNKWHQHEGSCPFCCKSLLCYNQPKQAAKTLTHKQRT